MEPVTHNPNTDHPEWNESYYFVFSNQEHNLRGMTRLGFKPNKEQGMMFFFLFLPDGSVAGYHITEKIQDYPGCQALGVGGMIHQQQPDGIWRYRYRGDMVIVKDPQNFPKIREHPELISGILPVKMELSFDPINDVYEYSEHMTPESLELGKKTGDAHWEQIAVIDGEIQVGEWDFPIRDTMAQRDHTHGIRDWTGLGDWLYHVIWFSKDLAVNPAAIMADDGRICTGGFLFKDGENIPIKSISVLDEKFSEDSFPISIELELVDALGEKHILKGESGPVIPLPFTDEGDSQSLLTLSFGNFELDGIPGGYGTFEPLRKIKK